MKKKFKKFFNRLPLQSKLLFIFLITSIISFSATVYMNRNINRKLEDIDNVYKSNAQLNNLANSLENLQSSMKDYLDTKTSSSLTEYYEYQQDYYENMDLLNRRILDNESAIMEKNIYNISNRYLEESEMAIKSKRARNISQYKIYYDEASQLYDYLNAYIFSLNNEQFMTNSTNYVTLAASLRLLERVSSLLSITVVFFNIIVIIMLTGQITKPLRALAETANEVARGNFDVKEVRVTSEDEIAIVSNAFNKMVLSIKEYIRRLTESIELENKAKERELLMKNHLKDAQLKYYQAQIHPHVP
ncbi:MAG TPA: HAMP domain-containing protein [Lachnospiraceae bacterium]|nr:HAMP domain-containing protein [Lachnospiraceae bacterium]